MFRCRRRSVLIKRLLRHRIVSSNETPRPLENVVYAMLKGLKEVQLSALMEAVESRGAEKPNSCVLVAKSDLRIGRGSVAPQVFSCQLWRWPDINNPLELKRLNHLCPPDSDPLYICFNPYHWSRLYKPDSPPPPYSKHPQEIIICKDREPSEPVSQETGGTNLYQSFQSHSSGCDGGRTAWCNIAYWELSRRVGRLFPVRHPSVDIFGDLPHGNGLCLGSLVESIEASNECVAHARSRISRGITIFKGEQEHEIYLYNKSEHPVFVNSPTLDPPNTRRLTVYKVQPGRSIKIFDHQKAEFNKMCEDPAVLEEGPFDPHTVRVSFLKGWGTRYSRRFVTSCPCWLEVIFLVNS